MTSGWQTYRIGGTNPASGNGPGAGRRPSEAVQPEADRPPAADDRSRGGARYQEDTGNLDIPLLEPGPRSSRVAGVVLAALFAVGIGAGGAVWIRHMRSDNSSASASEGPPRITDAQSRDDGDQSERPEVVNGNGSGGDPSTATGAPATSPPTTSPPTTVPPVTVPISPPLRPATPEDPILLWTLGDSTAQTVGEAIQIEVRDEPLITARTNFRVSSGLARPDYFDWETFLALFTLAQTPDAVVISIGANDAQGVTDPQGNVHLFGTPEWRIEYRRRVDKAMKLFTDAGIEVYWMAQPIAEDPEYSGWMRAINSVYREAALANPHAHYQDAWSWLSDRNGKYAAVLDGVEVRKEDGIHLSYAGGSRVAKRVVGSVKAHIAPPGDTSGQSTPGTTAAPASAAAAADTAGDDSSTVGDSGAAASH